MEFNEKYAAWEAAKEAAEEAAKLEPEPKTFDQPEPKRLKTPKEPGQLFSKLKLAGISSIVYVAVYPNDFKNGLSSL